MSARPTAPQKPRHIAPAIHVIATRLAQNTADRITIGNTPLHILHLCDARYLAPLFPRCHTLTAITVHLRYVASATALEAFLQAAATCPSLRDVLLIGGATQMEAAAIAAGLAAFVFPQAGAGGSHVDAAQLISAGPPPRATGRWCSSATPQISPCPSSASPSSVGVADQLRPQSSFFERPRQPWHASLLPPSLASASASAAVSPAQRSYGGRPLYFHVASPSAGAAVGTKRSTLPRRGSHHHHQQQRRPTSATSTLSTASRASCPDALATKGSVRFTLELHKVTEETAAVLLEGLRRGTRVVCATIHLRVGTAEARLAGLRLAHKARQATQLHRQQLAHSAGRAVLWPLTPPGNIAAMISFKGCGRAGRQQRMVYVPPSPLSGAPPPRPHSLRGHPAARRDAPHTPFSPSSTHQQRGAPPPRYAAWKPCVVSSAPSPPSDVPVGAAVAPHTPPCTRMTLECASASAHGGDAFRRRGRHFLSSERAVAPGTAAAAQQAWMSSQPLRLRAVPLVHQGEYAVPHTPLSRPRSAESVRNRAAGKRLQTARRASCAAVSVSESTTAVSSSFSPILAGSLLDFHRGRSSSFSSWSSRSTSPQPRRPTTPASPAACAYVSLAHRELDAVRSTIDVERRDVLRRPPRMPLSSLSPPVSPALCSPRYRLRRGRDGAHPGRAIAAATEHRAAQRTQLSSPSSFVASSGQSTEQRREQRSICSCFVCRRVPPPPPPPQEQAAPSHHTQRTSGTSQAPPPPSPHTPPQPRSRVAMQPRPTLPSPVDSPSAPSSSAEVSALLEGGGNDAFPLTPQRCPLHRDCHVFSASGSGAATAVGPRSVSLQEKGTCSDGTASGSTSTPGITARTPGAPRRGRHGLPARRRVSSATHAHSSDHHTSCRCVSHTRLPSSPDSAASCQRAMPTAPETTTTSSEGQSDSTEESEGYVVYPKSLKFLRARVAEINRHVVWHQVNAAKEAEAHARHLAALEVAFAGRVTTQLSDILMVLTDMEHGSRSGRRGVGVGRFEGHS